MHKHVYVYMHVCLDSTTNNHGNIQEFLEFPINQKNLNVTINSAKTLNLLARKPHLKDLLKTGHSIKAKCGQYTF